MNVTRTEVPPDGTSGDCVYRALFEVHPDAVLIFDDNGMVMHANPAALSLQAECELPCLSELLHSAEQQVQRLVVDAHDGGKQVLTCRVMPLPGPVGTKSNVLCIQRPMTDDALSVVAGDTSSAADRFAGLTPALVWACDAAGRQHWFNPRWLEFSGRSLEQECGDGWLSGVHPDDVERCAAIQQASVAERVPFSIDFRLRRQDGEFRWLMCTASPHADSDGRYAGHVGNCVDIDDRKRMEDQLAERTRALREACRRQDECLKLLSHELRSPSAPIAPAAGMLRLIEGSDSALAKATTPSNGQSTNSTA